MANSYWDHVIHADTNETDEFSVHMYFPNYEKLESFLETFTPFIQKRIFEEQLSMTNYEL